MRETHNAIYPDSEKLSEDEAHDEANVLRAQMGIDPKVGKMTKEPSSRYKGEYALARDEKEPTAEDYETALKTLEDLRELAQKDPSAFKRMLQYGLMPVVVISMPMDIISAGLHTAEEATKIGKKNLKAPWKEVGKVWESRMQLVFNDAKSKLERLKKEAENFGKKETEKI